MFHRVLSVALVILLGLPTAGFAVLYTCAMDGLTRMSNCEEHRSPPAMARSAHAAGHGDCARADPAPGECCDMHTVDASYDVVPTFELPSPAGLVSLVEAVGDASSYAPYATRVVAPKWRGPPLYERLSSYLI